MAILRDQDNSPSRRSQRAGSGACAENLIRPGGRAVRFRWRPDELVALRRSVRCGMMIGCAASTGLSGCDERVRVTAASSYERPGQGRGDLGTAPPDHGPGAAAGQGPAAVLPGRSGIPGRAARIDAALATVVAEVTAWKAELSELNNVLGVTYPNPSHLASYGTRALAAAIQFSLLKDAVEFQAPSERKKFVEIAEVHRTQVMRWVEGHLPMRDAAE